MSVSASVEEKAQERQGLCWRKEADLLRVQKRGQGGWSREPVTEPTWQRQEAGGPYAEIGSQCLAGTLLRTLRAARSGDSSLLCSFVCLFCFLRSFWLLGWRQ